MEIVAILCLLDDFNLYSNAILQNVLFFVVAVAVVSATLNLIKGMDLVTKSHMKCLMPPTCVVSKSRLPYDILQAVVFKLFKLGESLNRTL